MKSEKWKLDPWPSRDRVAVAVRDGPAGKRGGSIDRGRGCGLQFITEAPFTPPGGLSISSGHLLYFVITPCWAGCITFFAFSLIAPSLLPSHGRILSFRIFVWSGSKKGRKFGDFFPPARERERQKSLCFPPLALLLHLEIPSPSGRSDWASRPLAVSSPLSLHISAFISDEA